MRRIFGDVDLTAFWNESEYYAREYTDDPLTPEKISLVEAALGYKLPAAYIELMSNRNGGAPVKNCHRTAHRTSWASDHVAVTGFLSIGAAKRYSLCGSFGNPSIIEELGYPPIGIYFADCPSAGHDMLCLDYSSCGPEGEPRVVHVDQEWDYAVTHVAASFEAFVRGLETADGFPLD
ncbi:SMI1/KNR4 family protein [Alkalilimnicola ehrlichii]|uniref:SMI1/KNR4 family protein n=1 Tax=Alkalilimnicola ehrlichii TaxID=351052 RepID=A0A3E0WR18_9GAMM|nr:SMI1/KNR4 family protein [Alkalilimnicola ehrlichii]RFA27317.1 SMI1/KNR4 family protein [Alkalilimnicola ehrlichii]RFA34425.1 SMI1/KNR4 family protein [Alkalilimnicola ehrlichii]